jgi:3-oxoacyl-[acyl-carrier-protein] synthase III
MNITINSVNVSALSVSIPNNLVETSIFLKDKKEWEKISKSTGIKNLRIAGKKTTSSDLCFHSATHLINNYGTITNKDIDGISTVPL